MNYSNFMKVSMHKMFSIVVLAALVLSLVPLNQAQAAGVGNPDLECTNKGFDFGIAKWEWDDVDGAWEVEVDSPFPLAGYSTDVSGAPDAVAWTASPAVAGVLSKEGTETFVKTGGESGSFGQGSKAISHVTFC